jgi:outer membrane scaffolding protein for murein synthesis (MipA/OmpV family)
MMEAPIARCATPSRVVGWLMIACLASPTRAEQQPLLEAGLGIGAIAFEDYRGSGTVHAYPLPIPYLVYNGRFFKADREGIRGTLFHQDWIEMNLSANATTPVRNDRVRDGMPDLRSTLELGPSLDVHLLRPPGTGVTLDLRMPLRSALAVAARPRLVGWTFTPRLALDVAAPFGLAGWNAGMLAGPLFADRRYHAYYYSVAPQYVTVARPAYEAMGGYAGAQLILALSKRFPNCWVGAFMRYDTLSGAVFRDSPLVRTDGYWSAGFGISWMIHRSGAMVDVSR